MGGRQSYQPLLSSLITSYLNCGNSVLTAPSLPAPSLAPLISPHASLPCVLKGCLDYAL